MGFLIKTILILILTYYVIKTIVKWLLPAAIFKSQQRFQREQEQRVKKTKSENRPSFKGGEYIDFEEVNK